MESLTNLSRSLSINWLGEVPETYEERQAALKARFGDGFHGCLCSLCCYQKHRGDVKQVSHESSNEVAYFYMGMGDFAKAEGLLWRVIEHAMAKETDGQRAEFCLGESYHALGACLLNQGKWQEAHKVWCDGAAQVVSQNACETRRTSLPPLKSMRGKVKRAKKMSNDDSAQLPTCEEIYSEGVGYAAAVSGNRHLRKKIFILSGESLVSKETCEWVVRRAEEYAQTHGGWMRKRHYGAPTTDVPLSILDDVFKWFKESFFTSLRPTLQQQYYPSSDRANAKIAIHDAFIVKYDASTVEGQRFLPEHTDESTHSLVIALNDRGEYTGGGTRFPILKHSQTTKGPGIVFHRGSIRHSGEPIFEGTRYIIAAFLLLGTKKCSGVKNDAMAGKDFSFGFV